MYVPVLRLTYFLSYIILEINTIAGECSHRIYDSCGVFSTVCITFLNPLKQPPLCCL